MRVLIVEDIPTNLKLLRVSLEAAGVEVSPAADGLEALAVLETTPVDGVISDILMPRMDGYRLCREIRASARFAGLPFIMYTATYLSPEDERAARDLGADRFVRKPATADALIATLRDVIGSRTSAAPAAPPPTPELHAMKQYSERLVAKLEDTYLALQERSDELRSAHEQLERILAHSPAVIYRLRIDGETITPVYVSDNVQRLSGVSAAASTSFEWWRDSLHPMDRERVLAAVHRGLREGGYSMEYRVGHRDGTYRWVEDKNRVLMDAAGQPLEAFGVWTDITDRKKAVETIARLAALVESSNDAIIGETLEAEVTSWNPAAARMFGYSAAEMVGRPLTVLIPPGRGAEETDILGRVARGPAG